MGQSFDSDERCWSSGTLTHTHTHSTHTHTHHLLTLGQAAGGPVPQGTRPSLPTKGIFEGRSSLELQQCGLKS